VSKIRFFGMICFAASVISTMLFSTTMHAQSLDPGLDINDRHRQFDPALVPVGSHSIELLSASGETALVEQAPQPSANQPISGIVSLRDLQHPVPKKAIKEAHEAEQFARAGDLPKAIAKFEKAIRIHPAYRDAHLDLGVQYARVGRAADARAEFEKALDIGPPAAPIYADLALTSLGLHRYQEAQTFAQKALALDPANMAAQQALGYASAHGF
jgi:tetratricopeptide (TPR) repeat protein